MSGYIHAISVWSVRIAGVVSAGMLVTGGSRGDYTLIDEDFDASLCNTLKRLCELGHVVPERSIDGSGFLVEIPNIESTRLLKSTHPVIRARVDADYPWGNLNRYSDLRRHD